jgi:hypothetical protein
MSEGRQVRTDKPVRDGGPYRLYLVYQSREWRRFVVNSQDWDASGPLEIRYRTCWYSLVRGRDVASDN